MQRARHLCLMLTDTGTADPIPLPNVSSKILAKVIEYAKFHTEAAKKAAADDKAKNEDEVKQWDADFVKVDQATLFELILVSCLQFSPAFLQNIFLKHNCL